MSDDELFVPISDEELSLDLSFGQELLEAWTAAFSAALSEQLS